MSRILYYAYNNQRPSGGQKQTYRHVDILNAAGCEAYVVHESAGYRLNWFQNSTRVIDRARLNRMLNADDIVVLPETLGPALSLYPCRKVTFNKGLYIGYGSQPIFRSAADPFRSPGVVAMFAVGEHNRRNLVYGYPDLPVIDVGVGVDASRFRFAALSDKQLTIACVAKAQNALHTVCGLLRARLAHFRVPQPHFVLLRGMSETEVASVLHRSLALLMLNHEEGLPQTVVEAVLSGCIIVAPAIGPLAEFVPRAGWFQPGEPAEAAAFLMSLIVDHPKHSIAVRQHLSENGRVAQRYACKFEAERVLDAWDTVLSLSASVGEPLPKVWPADPCPPLATRIRQRLLSTRVVF